MAEVTARLARSLGLDSFTDLTAAQPTVHPNPDGTVTFTFPDEVPAETLAIIRERMVTRDDEEVERRAALREAFLAAAADDLPPEDATTEQLVAWLVTQVGLLRGVGRPLADLVLGTPTTPEP